MELRRQAHSVYRCQYHIVWIPRYRHKILVEGVKEYLEISVKNDDALIKMAAIVQRLSTASTVSGEAGMLTETEMNQLMEVAEEISKTTEKPKQIGHIEKNE